jgi:hypothetical protein
MSKKADTTEAGPVRSAPDVAPSALAAVTALMDERRRFESWLAALEARRDTTPPRVFTRVHADYTTRLEGVVGQLTTHVESLRGELDSLTGRLAAAHDEQQQARDERAEAELRAHVGELSADEWEKTAQAADERIDVLVSRHADLEMDLQRTRQLLADAERPATPPGSSAAVGSARAPDPAADASVSASVQAASAHPTPGPVAAVGDSAEAAMHVPGGVRADECSDAGVPAELPPAVIAAEAQLIAGEAASPADSSPPAPRGRGTASFDELAFLNSVVDTPTGGATRAPAEEPARKEPPRAEPAPVRRESYTARPRGDSGIENRDATADTSVLGKPARKGTPLAANVSGNNPIVLRDQSLEGAKTLKCADCSAMNYPTEWYCERCGAELASL